LETLSRAVAGVECTATVRVDCVVENNIFTGNKDWQVDFHGWTTQQNFWGRHLPAMVTG
jgi:hypothetical protein